MATKHSTLEQVIKQRKIADKKEEAYDKAWAKYQELIDRLPEYRNQLVEADGRKWVVSTRDNEFSFRVFKCEQLNED
jgi:hypothetical protein